MRKEDISNLFIDCGLAFNSKEKRDAVTCLYTHDISSQNLHLRPKTTGGKMDISTSECAMIWRKQLIAHECEPSKGVLYRMLTMVIVCRVVVGRWVKFDLSAE